MTNTKQALETAKKELRDSHARLDNLVEFVKDRDARRLILQTQVDIESVLARLSALAEGVDVPFAISDFPEWVREKRRWALRIPLGDGWHDEWFLTHPYQKDAATEQVDMWHLSHQQLILYRGPLTNSFFTALCEALNIK